MTRSRILQIKAALQEQRKRVTASRAAATKFINDAGIRALIIDGEGDKTETVLHPKKTTAKKTAK